MPDPIPSIPISTFSVISPATRWPTVKRPDGSLVLNTWDACDPDNEPISLTSFRTDGVGSVLHPDNGLAVGISAPACGCDSDPCSIPLELDLGNVLWDFDDGPGRSFTKTYSRWDICSNWNDALDANANFQLFYQTPDRYVAAWQGSQFYLGFSLPYETSGTSPNTVTPVGPVGINNGLASELFHDDFASGNGIGISGLNNSAFSNYRDLGAGIYLGTYGEIDTAPVGRVVRAGHPHVYFFAVNAYNLNGGIA